MPAFIFGSLAERRGKRIGANVCMLSPHGDRAGLVHMGMGSARVEFENGQRFK